MDSIVGYRSDDEQDSDTEYKSRGSNSVLSNTSHHSGSNNKKTAKDATEKSKHSPDRRRKDPKVDSSSSDRNSTHRSKSDRRDNWDRPRDEQERPRNDAERSRNDADKSRENRDRPYDRKLENRDRDDRRRDRQQDRHHRPRDNRSRNDRDRRHWRSRSSSRERHTNPDSPSDKREKDRKRHSTQTSSSQERSAHSSSRNASSHSQDLSYSQGKAPRDYDRVSESRDQNLGSVAPKDTPYQSAASMQVNDFDHQQKAPDPSSSSLPSYYNPNVMNPNKYAEQVQKRKLLWGNKKSEDTATKWGSAKFAQDTDGKVASKFMRLMGIKDKPKPGEEVAAASTRTTGSEIINKQEEMFSSMEQQYEVARQATHTMRGVGLGFSSQARPF